MSSSLFSDSFVGPERDNVDDTVNPYITVLYRGAEFARDWSREKFDGE